ncbi:MAG: RNA 2',3'-cyclic phosphodiesterase, partial [Acidimicrobiia bacterium]
MESVGRIFVAIGFPAEVRVHLADRLAHLPIPIVPAANLHLTLRFLGDIDPVGLDRLLAALDESRWPAPFPLRLGGLWAFPKPAKATVVWIDAVGDRLEELAETVEDACEEAGLGREERPFRPHVTVSRLRPPADVRALIAGSDPFELSTPVDEIVV